MDTYDMVTLVLIAIVILLVVTLFYYLALMVYRGSHDGYKMIWRWRVYDFTEDVVNILSGDSIYKGKTVPKKDEFMSYYSTVDDPLLLDVSNLLVNRCKGSTKTQMKFILRFVQQNVDYVKDINQYGKSEYYVLPINTLTRQKGDCEDSSFLFQCLTYPLGYDMRAIRITGHLTTGVHTGCLIPFTTSYTIGGVKYKQAETTNTMPFGCVFGNHEVLYSATPQVPTSDFTKNLVTEVVL